MEFRILWSSSTLDNNIIAIFILAVLGCLLLNWIIKKCKFQSIKEELLTERIEYIENYNLEFGLENTADKTVGFWPKFALFAFSLVMIFVPLYEFIETIKPKSYFPWGCTIF
ncbi:MAG TPA: hypothetical protein VKZ97_06285 [Flavobacteriaceae bacterium]|nr:hypothetical protein [Flavobacteriaceae bacterium]